MLGCDRVLLLLKMLISVLLIEVIGGFTGTL